MTTNAAHSRGVFHWKLPIDTIRIVKPIAPQLAPACALFAGGQMLFTWYVRGDSLPITNPAFPFLLLLGWVIAGIALGACWIARTKQTTGWGLTCAALVLVGTAASWLAFEAVATI